MKEEMQNMVMLISPFFWLATLVRRKTVQRYRETPFGILRRRSAAGEITTKEYEGANPTWSDPGPPRAWLPA